jgi:Domain of unknown function (DUF1707)
MPATPPGDAAGAPRSLLGDADRDRLTTMLREHYAAGRISLDELRRRVGVVLAAAYADEAAVALADLPPIAATAGPAGPSAQGKPRHRGRHAQTAEPQPGWVPTPERFRDPSSGAIMRVWTDPADGSRHYVPDDGPL